MSKSVWRVLPALRHAVCVGRDLNYAPGEVVDETAVPEQFLNQWANNGWIEKIEVDDVPEDLKPTQPVDPKASRGPWRLDPKLLEGKELLELNIMVHEADPSVEPFETVEEAVDHLTQDFQG